MKDMLKDQVALITGGASGMGEATAKLFASEGAIAIIGDCNVQNGKRVVDEIIIAGGTARFYSPMDVSRKDTIKSVIDPTINEFGRIDILAAYAGRTFDGGDMTEDERYKVTYNVNAIGASNVVFAVLPYMKKHKSGKIIIHSSNGAFSPTNPDYPYHMAKGALEALTVNLVLEVAPLGIRVNCIKPGLIETPYWDQIMEPGDVRTQFLNAIGKYEVPDVANVALFFASELSSYITGHCIYAAGGMGYIYSHKQSFA